MKASKAIEIISRIYIPLKTATDHDTSDAVKLGIEALRRHRSRDYLTYNQMHELLPGETPEEDVT